MAQEVPPRKLSMSPQRRIERGLRLDTLDLEAAPLGQRVFEYLDKDHNGTISAADIFAEFDQCGLRHDDPRIAPLCSHLEAHPDLVMDFETFQSTTKDCAETIEKCFGGQLCIPKFNAFRSDVEGLFDETCAKSGLTARTAKATFAVSLCTVDGQRHVMGTSPQPGAIEFCLEECCKPILYSMAMETHTDIDEYISHEPSGLGAHAMALQTKKEKKRPHNPLMNTGALVSCALLLDDNSAVDTKFNGFLGRVNTLFSRDSTPSSSPSVSSMEEATYASINKSIAYMLDAAHCFPPKTNIDDVLGLFFRSCAARCTVDELSVFAATLANGGVHPISGDRVMQPQTVHHCLSVMYSCGLGTYSGEWAFHVGMPALSSLGGAMIVVVPGVMGFSSYSPPLDASQNSINGVSFFKAIANKFTFHNFDSLPMINLARKDPRRNSRLVQEEITTKLLIAAAEGDVCEIRRLRSRGANLNGTDYDSRTALHLAASEGKISVVNYLVKHGASLGPVDRWGGTPMSDAITFGHLHVAQLLTKAGVTSSKAPVPFARHSSATRPMLLRDMTCFYAAANGDVDHLKSLLSEGFAFASLRDYDARTPLHVAAAEGRLDVVQFLVERAHVPIDVKDRSQRTPLSEARRSGHAPIVDFLRKALKAPMAAPHAFPSTPRTPAHDSDDELEGYEMSSHSATQFLLRAESREANKAAIVGANEASSDESHLAKVDVRTLLRTLRESGLLENDPRLRKLVDNVKLLGLDATLSYEQYRYLTESGAILLEKAMAHALVIPNFGEFCDEMIDIFERAKLNRDGHIATYIPQLANVDPEKFGMALCTVDGQRFSLGDATDTFCVQSCSKTISYCLAVEELGPEKVHFHMGCEPSGLRFNDLSLLERNGFRIPHNPMINSGAIMSSSLIRRDLPLHQRFEYVMSIWSALCGDVNVGFDNSVCLSERSSADRNCCLGYMMREAECLPDDTDLMETLEFYFEQCSLTANCAAFSVLAASLATGGVCPLTNHRIFKAETVRNCLSLMFSCGMYDASGTWSYRVGIPAKSGVSGVLLLVIPNVMGVALWSPRLDEIGNSVRGIQFSEELVQRFAFHNFDAFVEHSKLPSPVFRGGATSSGVAHDAKQRRKLLYPSLYAAYEGNVEEIRRLKLLGADVNAADYDGRTAMHIAASMGHVAVLKELVYQGGNVHAVDRWGGTPLSDATRYAPSNADAVVHVLQQAMRAHA
ncbi:hypothetical protein SDRG_09518 [Saprolegnia diclina VS20]|uniref:glutaminase n=1 Tax=Saprolegnia diclina (strain VS20) TaxID=1156394 RepID=T0QE50_SAPDV|nr:hypothetical protein SDRG_09518 [Saprolegnia diclina VS20]EQC32996.1 hypothetical protein SDRG_09518 [Saprolegnia diclina VS20]|eukprot:XP_008613682.1 hypothetical protein SDRG_09518 [Saprolegnia diclina VS20]